MQTLGLEYLWSCFLLILICLRTLWNTIFESCVTSSHLQFANFFYEWPEWLLLEFDASKTAIEKKRCNAPLPFFALHWIGKQYFSKCFDWRANMFNFGGNLLIWNLLNSGINSQSCYLFNNVPILCKIHRNLSNGDALMNLYWLFRFDSTKQNIMIFMYNMNWQKKYFIKLIFFE